MRSSRSVSIPFVVVVAQLGAVASAAPPARSRDAVIADYRSHTDDYRANQLIAAFKLADQGDTSQIAEERKGCIALKRTLAPYERELCAFYEAYFMPKDAPSAIDAKTVLGLLGGAEPFPTLSFRGYYASKQADSSGCSGNGCLNIWDQYCDEYWRALDAGVQQCTGVECAMMVIRAAQVETACVQPLPELVAEVHRVDANYPVTPPLVNIGELTGFVSRVARSRSRSTIGDVAKCQQAPAVTLRCIEPSATSLSFDDYRVAIDNTIKTFAPVLTKYFAEADKALREEIVALDAAAANAEKRCVVPAQLTQPPNGYFTANGCVEANLPRSKLKPFQDAYQAAWAKHVQEQQEKAQAEQTAVALEKARADKAARDRADVYRRQAEAKLASKDCKVAQGWGQYCDTSERLTAVEAAIKHQQRVDRESGTVDASARRRLAETKLLVQDQLSANAKELLSLGVKPARSQCKAVEVRAKAIQDACVLAPLSVESSSRAR